VTERAFFDTNVLIYADDASAGAKRDRAADLILDALRNSTGVLSSQVLQEYFVAATRKLGLDPARARARVEVFLKLPVVIVDPAMILAAIDLHRLDAISFWDALIIKAASAGGCDVLYSEDLQDGRVIDGMVIRNPFSAASPGRGGARRSRSKAR
jgi:predicted nucleic acid-binding protein